MKYVDRVLHQTAVHDIEVVSGPLKGKTALKMTHYVKSQAGPVQLDPLLLTVGDAKTLVEMLLVMIARAEGRPDIPSPGPRH